MFRPSMALEEKPPLAATITGTAPVGGMSSAVDPAPDAPELGERDHRRYEFIAEHGRGGLGRVMRTRDKDLRREVAIKEILNPGGIAEARFVREAMLTARLEHPGIVPVHDAGRWDDGTPFYSMKLVSGRPLKDLLNTANSLDARLALLPNVIAVCEAIAYAHSRGIIHRDLKPSNIIVGDFGETVVIDWGLAKDLKDSAHEAPIPGGPFRTAPKEGLTVSGAVMGTPAYMSPEQAHGAYVDERTDVYAIGAILYHLLSGKPPFPGPGGQALAALVAGPPAPLDQFAPAVPKDLLAVTSKAMHRDVSLRYPNAGALAADLSRFQVGQLVTARSYETKDLVGRWIRKHRTLVATSVISALIIAVLSTLGLRRIFRERDRAESAEQRAVRQRDLVILSRASDSLDRDPTSTLAWLKLLPTTSDFARRRTQLIRQALSRGIALHVRNLNPRGLGQVKYSEDKKRLAVTDVQGKVTVFDADNWKAVSSFAGSSMAPLLIDTNGAEIATAGFDGAIVDWQLNKGTHQIPAHHGYVLVGAMLPHSRVLYTAGVDGDVRRTDLDAGTSLVVASHGKTIRTLAISLDGARIATGSDAGKIIVLSTTPETSASDTTYFRPLTTARIFDVDFLEDGRLLAAQSDGNVSLFDPSGHLIKTFNFSHDDVDHVRVSGVQPEAYVLGYSGTITRIDLTTLKTERLATSDIKLTNSALCALGSGEELLVACYSDGTVRYWYLRSRISGQLRQHGGSVSAVDVSASTVPRIASVALDGTLRVWEISPPLVTRLYSHESSVLTIASSSDGQILATAGQDRIVKVSMVGRPVANLIGHSDVVNHLQFTRNGNVLLSSSWDRTLRAWNVTTGHELARHEFAGTPGALISDDLSRVLVAVNHDVFAWNALTDDVAEVCHIDADILYIFPDSHGSGFYLVTSDHRLLQVAAAGAEPRLVLNGVVSVLSSDLALVDPSSTGHSLEIRDYEASKTVQNIQTTFSPAASIYDARGDALFLFGPSGEGWITAGKISMAVQGDGKTVDVFSLPDTDNVVRVTQDGGLELWRPDKSDVLMARPAAFSFASSLYIPALKTIVLGTRSGEVLLIHTNDLQDAWNRNTPRALDELTDYQVDPAASLH